MRIRRRKVHNLASSAGWVLVDGVAPQCHIDWSEPILLAGFPINHHLGNWCTLR